MNAAVVDALAVARLARLITTDRAGRPIRIALTRLAYRHGPPPAARAHNVPAEQWATVDSNEPPALAELVRCRWCTSMWCAVVVVAARRVCPTVWDPLAHALAASWAAGMSGVVEDAAHQYTET